MEVKKVIEIEGKSWNLYRPQSLIYIKQQRSMVLLFQHLDFHPRNLFSIDKSSCWIELYKDRVPKRHTNLLV